MKTLPLALVFFLSSSASAARKQCYYPDGGETNDDRPCDPDADNSPCCHGGPGWSCLSNKLCQGPDGNLIRGSCTDEAFESGECPLHCLAAETGGTDLISCSNVTQGDSSYCCDHTVNCCDSGVGRFQVLPENPTIWASWNSGKSKYVTVAAATSTSASTSTAPTSTSDSESSSKVSELSTAAKAGIGVGFIAAFVLAGIGAILLWKRYRDKRARARAGAGPQDQGQYPQPGTYPQQQPPFDGKYASHYTELSSQSPLELDASPAHRPAELPGHAG